MKKDLYTPSVHGVGYMGEGKYKSTSKAYKTWKHMLTRCYDPKYHATRPTYKGCSVCTEWHNFQVFAKWFEDNYIEGYHLDKDSITKGNKEYSPSNCVFLSQAENTITSHAKTYKFIHPTGGWIEVYNLKAFCKKHFLDSSAMYAVAKGKRKSHKGWKRGS